MRSTRLFQRPGLVKALLIAILCCSTHQWATSQINISTPKATLGQVINQIKSQTKYQFFYDDRLSGISVDAVDVKDVSLKELLDKVLKGKNITYKIEDNIVYLSSNDRSDDAYSSEQKRTATGTVVDESGEPLIGATVLIKGTTAGVITDMDGKFTLTNIPGSAKTLVISYVGMKTKEITISSKPVKVILESDAKNLEEVVVVAFGKSKKSAFTGSAGVVKAEKIVERQVSNPISALAGKVAGVQMTEGGSPTSTPTLRIRGISSINASNDPLVVVDGMPYDGYWYDINPSDVESITVLKDAASNALYGARGANGVIMITTKTAKIGKATITFDSKWGVNTDAKKDYDYIKNPGEYYEAYYLGLYNYYKRAKGLSAYDAHLQANNTMGLEGNEGGLAYIIYNVPDGQYLIGENGKLTPNATLGNIVNYNGKEYLLTPDSWKDEGLRNGLRQEYNLNLSGGTEKFQFYGSLGYMKNEGICYGSDLTRYSSRMKADYQALDWLKVGGNMTYTHTETNGLSGAFGVAHGIAPIYPVYVRDGQGNIMTDKNGKVYDYGDGVNAGLTRPTYKKSNAIQSDLLDVSYNNSNSFNVQGYADISFLKDFKLTLNASVFDTENRSSSVGNSFYGYNTSLGGSVSISHYRTYTLNFQQLLNYNKTIDAHSLSVLLGHEYYKFVQTTLTGAKRNMFSYFGNHELAGAIVKNDMNSYDSRSNTEGYFFRVQYDYDTKYFLSGSFRRDGSSKFHPDHRWGNFWSLGGAWIINKENWYNVDWLNMLKAKMSYGEQGNDGIGNYLYTDYYYIGSIDNEISLTFANKGNKKITWETNGNFNAGVEFELFKSRLSGSIEYFRRKTNDMLFYFSVPVSLGYSGYWDNVGDMVNNGLEIDLNTTILNTKKFKWDVNLNMTYYKNKVTYLPEDKKSTTMDGYPGYISGEKYIAEGLPLNTWRLKKYAGVSNDGIPMWYYDNENGERQTTTNYDEADYYLCGNAMPKVYGGFGTTLSYAGVDLNVNFAYSIGGKSYDSGYSGLMTAPYADATGKNIHKDALKGWSETNPTSDIPRWQYGDLYTAAGSDRWLTNASTLTLQNINLGYTLPTRLTKALLINKVRLYMACDNVFYWSKRKGFDPRTSFDGSTSAGDYSQMRTISGGINIQF